MPDIDKIIALEAGELPFDEVVDLIQDGIATGWVWQLQGWYGRLAQRFIDEGLCEEV